MPALMTTAADASAVRRVVTVGGAITEIAFGLGEGAKIVAVDTTSLYPPQAVADLPKVGYMRQLSTEGLLSTRPDLILLDADAGPPDIVAQLARMAPRVAQFQERSSAASVAGKITFVGGALGQEAKARAMTDFFTADLMAVERVVRNLSKKPKVLFLMNAGSTGLRAAGAQTGAADMISLAGGVNAFGMMSGYKPLAAEAALQADPEVVLVMDQTLAELGGVGGLAKLPALVNLRAVQDGRVIGMDGAYLLGFGPRTAHAARDLVAALHPQLSIPSLPARPWSA
jgi:iron complex transport system substrate-binding protein